MTKERVAFERWAATKGYDIDVMPAREPQNAGEYYDQTTQDSWVAWQARAAFPGESPAENSPVSKSAPEPTANPSAQLIEAVHALGKAHETRSDEWPVDCGIGYASAIDDVLEILRGLPDQPAGVAETISLDTASADPLACLHPVVMGDDGTGKKWCYTCGATL